MTRFLNHVALVTGGGSGIGRATAQRLAREGASVAIVDRDAAGAEETQRLIEADGVGRGLPIPTDVGHEAEVAAAVTATIDAFGRLDHVVTAAGVFIGEDFAPFAAVPLDTFMRVLQINLVGTVLAIQNSLPHLVETNGSIVTIASTAAIRGHGHGSGYTASKGAITALSRLIAVQYGPEGVRINCICPGGTDTPMTGGAWNSDAAQASLRKTVPLQKIAQPEELASTAAFLLSVDASHITGQTLVVDGGATIA
jgi:NAD(P)-dependent dehydrogenase (short-subunit alcohol dehydrogenase family)